MDYLRSPSHHAQYLIEREDASVLEASEGFVVYFINPDQKMCYIRDIYVAPQHRHGHIAAKLATQVAIMAKEQGCNHVIGTVSPTANGSTASLRVLLGWGMYLHKASDNCIIFKKDI